MVLTDPAYVRRALDRLIRERGADYASLSRLLGRNAAYVQQFIKRGVPRKLDEEDRRTLARYFGVSERMLGGPSRASGTVQGSDLVMISCLDTEASAGAGAVVDAELAAGRIAFGAESLRSLCAGSPDGLSVIRVKGDSMVPTLGDGDEILVDRNDAAGALRDGIYVLRLDELLSVKRISCHPGGRGFEVRSDNPVYPAWVVDDPASIAVIGRVVWVGRRIP